MLPGIRKLAIRGWIEPSGMTTSMFWPGANTLGAAEVLLHPGPPDEGDCGFSAGGVALGQVDIGPLLTWMASGDGEVLKTVMEGMVKTETALGPQSLRVCRWAGEMARLRERERDATRKRVVQKEAPFFNQESECLAFSSLPGR